MNGSAGAGWEPGTGRSPGLVSTATSIGRSRGRLVMGAWLAGLLIVVGAAIGGRLVGSGDPIPRTAAFVLGPADDAPKPGPTASPAPTPDLIVLVAPAHAGITITTRDLDVRGFLQGGVATVRVTLEARGNRIIDDATIEPTLAFGERPIGTRYPQFAVEFGLPNPRPNGRMIVQVAAYDADGRILDVIRRPFRVGPLLEGAGA